MLYFIEQNNIKTLLIDLVKSWNVFAPVEQEGRDILLEKLPGNSEELEKYLDRISLNSKIDNKQTLIPPKEAFLPQSEVMFTYSSDSSHKGESLIDNSDSNINTAKPVLLFGIKPCDYYALNITGSFFKNGFKDFYYLSKSKNYLALIFGCITPPEPESCFCSSAGTGPVLSKDRGQNFDIQFIEASQDKKTGHAEGYFVETGTDRGNEFIKTNSSYFKILPDQKAVEQRLINIKETAFKNIELSVNFEKALTVMSKDTEAGMLNNAYSKIADRCIYCGGCLYVCPTCTCFNVYDSTESPIAQTDETLPVKGERVRVWDTCVFSGYTREASRHNPRGEAYTRAARRYEHKLKYDPAVYGRSSCVGCGRCLTACPVNIGMSTFIREITENHEE